LASPFRDALTRPATPTKGDPPPLFFLKRKQIHGSLGKEKKAANAFDSCNIRQKGTMEGKVLTVDNTVSSTDERHTHGLGMQIDSSLTVTFVGESGQAIAGGVAVGDRITAMAGQSMAGKTDADAVAALTAAKQAGKDITVEFNGGVAGPQVPQAVKELFEKIDMNSDGEVTKMELIQTLAKNKGDELRARLGLPASADGSKEEKLSSVFVFKQALEKSFGDMDADKDGFITITEFANFLETFKAEVKATPAVVGHDLQKFKATLRRGYEIQVNAGFAWCGPSFKVLFMKPGDDTTLFIAKNKAASVVDAYPFTNIASITTAEHKTGKLIQIKKKDGDSGFVIAPSPSAAKKLVKYLGQLTRLSGLGGYIE
jgi:hypothetical protein